MNPVVKLLLSSRYVIKCSEAELYLSGSLKGYAAYSTLCGLFNFMWLIQLQLLLFHKMAMGLTVALFTKYLRIFFLYVSRITDYGMHF